MNLRALFQLIGVIVLLAGLGSSVMIYRTAGDEAYGVLGYEEGSGVLYPVMPDDSKLYRRNLEIYGGKAEVLIDGLRRWFMGLWFGKSLAFTVAFLALFVSAGFFYGVRWVRPRSKTEPSKKEDDHG